MYFDLTLIFLFFSSSRNGWCPPLSRRSALTIASKCMSSATNISLSLSRPLLLRHWMKIGSITKILLISWTWWKIVPMLFWKSWAGFKKSTNANLLSWMVSNPGLWTFKKSSNYKFQKIGFKRNKALNYFSLWKAFFFIPIFKIRLYISVCVKTNQKRPNFFQNLKAYTQKFLGRLIIEYWLYQLHKTYNLVNVVFSAILKIINHLLKIEYYYIRS